MNLIQFGVVAVLLVSSSILAQTSDSESSLKVEHVQAAEYPAMAMAARVSGDVNLSVILGADGIPTSVTVDSGPPMLRQAAVDSATRSKFQVILGSRTGAYRVIYRFIFNTDQKCDDERDSSYPHITHQSNIITIEAQPFLICDPAGVIERVRARSGKCLFLWRCGWKAK